MKKRKTRNYETKNKLLSFDVALVVVVVGLFVVVVGGGGLFVVGVVLVCSGLAFSHRSQPQKRRRTCGW